MDVLSLLESKNRCLQRFHDLSVAFLRDAEQGDLKQLELFHERREAAIRALNLYDGKINSIVASLPFEDRTPQLARKVELVLASKDEIVRQILVTDERIIRKIEEEKTKILKDINSTEKSRSNIGKFKSTWVAPNGEGLDEKL
jgi:hypothetical protein